MLSTNLVLRRDGWPKSGQRKPSDPGVAVYFVRKGKDFCIACDKYDDVKSNIRAIGLALEGLRAVERAGVTELLDRAFQGFAKLPSAIVTTAPPDFRKVLGLDKNWPWDLTEDQAHEDLTMHYKAAARKAHPDSGGSHESSVRVNAALAEAKKVLKDWRFE